MRMRDLLNRLAVDPAAASTLAEQYELDVLDVRAALGDLDRVGLVTLVGHGRWDLATDDLNGAVEFALKLGFDLNRRVQGFRNARPRRSH